MHEYEIPDEYHVLFCVWDASIFISVYRVDFSADLYGTDFRSVAYRDCEQPGQISDSGKAGRIGEDDVGYC